MCCQSFLEVLPALDDHFKLSLSHSSALRMAMLMYLCTSLLSPSRLVSCVDIALTCPLLLFCKERLHKEAMPE